MTWPTPPNANDGNFDSLLGGRSVPTASFKGQFPIRWEGVVEEATKKPAFKYDPSKPNNRGEQQFWPDGNPVENVWVTIQTNVRTSQEDDGRRIIVLDSKNKLEAVQAAVRDSGASFARGGHLTLEWYGNDPNGKNPDNPPKLYRALYQGPTLDSALATNQPGWGAPAPTPPAPAQQAWGAPPAQAPTPPAPAQQAPTWGAPAPAAPTPPAAPAQGGWGGPPEVQNNAAAAGWGAPAPQTPPPAQQPPQAALDPNVVAQRLTAMGVAIPPGTTVESLMSLAAVYGITQ